MNLPNRVRVPVLPGFAVGIFLVLLGWLGGGLRAAQLTFGDATPLLPAPPANVGPDLLWPAVEWGLRVTLQEPGLSMELLSGQETILPPGEEFSPAVSPAPAVSFRTTGAHAPVAAPAPAKAEPAPSPLSEIAASPTDEKEPAPATQTPLPKWSAQHLGDSEFNQAAESLNVHRADDGRTNDLSRQFGGTANVTKNVATGSPINGWAILILAALVAFAAVALGQYESDKDDRERRKNSRRHRRHRHSE